jgi:hypothetical protein
MRLNISKYSARMKKISLVRAISSVGKSARFSSARQSIFAYSQVSLGVNYMMALTQEDFCLVLDICHEL